MIACPVDDAPTSGGAHARDRRLSVVYLTEEGAGPAVRDVSLSVHAGQTVGLVGESGSGKTTLALGAIGYLPANGRVESGTSRARRHRPAGRSRRELRRIWGSKIGLVSQNPQAALNPTLTMGRQLDEMGRRHLGLGRRAARVASLAMLERVAMPDSQVGRVALSPPTLRWDAPALRDRHGATHPPRPSHPGRAHHRPGRHHPGHHPRSARGSEGRVPDGHPLHHSQPGGGRLASATGSPSCTPARSSRRLPRRISSHGRFIRIRPTFCTACPGSVGRRPGYGWRRSRARCPS